MHAIIFPLIFLYVACAQEVVFPVLPGIVSALNGYDLVLSSPFGGPGSAVDTGVRRPIFAAEYTRNITAVFNDQTYAIPDGLSPPTPAKACSYSSSFSAFTTITSAADFQASMQQFSVGASLGFPSIGLGAAAFSGSAVFQSMWKSQSDVTVSNLATCSVFSAFINTVEMPPLTSEFAGRVAALDPADAASLFTFSRDFGTHYVKESVYGGVAYTYTKISEASYQAFNAQGFSYASAAGLMFLGAIGADVSSSNAYAAYQALNASSLEKYSQFFSAPVPPPAPANVNSPDSSAWLDLIDVGGKYGPATISIPSLAPIVSLLTPQNFPNDPAIAAKAAALLSYLTSQYCVDLNPKPGCVFETNNPIIAYFSATRCPAGWSPHGPSGGRVIFAADGSVAFPPGVINGVAMASLEAPTHSHSYEDHFDIGLTSLAAARGGGFNILGAGRYTYSSATAASPGLPFIQLVVCTNANASSTPIEPIILPTNAGVFFDTDTNKCPPLTIPTPDAAGYTPVSGAALDPTSPPLSFGAAITHTHPVSGQYQLPGGCTSFCRGGGDGGASSGNPSATSPLTTSAADLPYITMLMCESRASDDKSAAWRVYRGL
jgi:hypothetical protein